MKNENCEKLTVRDSVLIAVGATFTCALWGISTPIVKLGYNHIESSDIPSLLLWAGLEFIIAGFFTFLFASAKEKRILYPKKENIPGVLLVSLFQTVLQYLGLYVGLQLTTSVKGAILKSTDVFFIILISCLIFKHEKLTFGKIAACVIGFAGIIAANLNGLRFDVNLGDGIVVLGIVFYSLSVVLTKQVTKSEEPLTLCSYQMTVGGIVMLAIGLSFGGSMDYKGMAPILVILSFIYAVSYSVWTVLLQKYPASKVTIFSFMTPIFGVLFSFIILREQSSIPLLNLIIALLLVSVGIILQSRTKN